MEDENFCNVDNGGQRQTTQNNPIIITAPVGAKYLTDFEEFKETLPAGILNKKETGCGATSVVLENREDVVLCCPTIQLIQSKLSQYPGDRSDYTLFGVMKGVSVQDIETYVEWCAGKQPVKFLTTYDSLPKVAVALGDNLHDCKIVVDEYQELLDSAVFRDKAVKNLLRGLRGYDNATYLSATPIPYNFNPEELTGLPQYEIFWPEAIKIKPYRIQTDSPFSVVANIIFNHKAGNPLVIEGHPVQEYFFFVNSVKAIRRIIKAAGLATDEVKIVCAKGDINKLKLGDGYRIQDISDPNKTFTFCTKTVFYGADFYSEAGLAIVVSDGFVKSTLLDISSDMRQIAGRIRTESNPFKNMILHIHSPSAVLPSEEEFEVELAKRIKDAEQDIKAFEQLVPKGLEGVIINKQETNEPEAVSYYDPETHSIRIDTLKIAHMRHKFKTINSVYTDGITMRNAYEEAGYNVDEAETWIKNVRHRVSMAGTIDPFQEYYLIYSEEKKKMSIGQTDLATDIAQKYPLIPQAYCLLGDDKVFKLKFDEDKVRQWVHFASPTTQSALKRELRDSFLCGFRYSNKDAKSILHQIFGRLGIELTPTVSFLRHYFGTKKVKLTIPESPHRKDGIEITRGIIMMSYGYRRSA